MKRTASAVWHGDLKKGHGALATRSGVLKNTPYSFVHCGCDPVGLTVYGSSCRRGSFIQRGIHIARGSASWGPYCLNSVTTGDGPQPAAFRA